MRGMWNAECGVWSAERGVWSVRRPLRHKDAKLFFCLVVILALTVTVYADIVPAKKAVSAIKVKFEYQVVVLYRDRIELTGGRPFVKAEDGSYRIEANKIIITIAELKKSRTTIAALKKDQTTVRSATAEGNVVMMAKPPDSSQQWDATASKAQYFGDQAKAILTGNVRVVVTDPELFAEPAVSVGETATFNLRPKGDEWRIRVEGAPGRSELTVTPKPKE